MTLFFDSIHFTLQGFDYFSGLFIFFAVFCSIGWIIEMLYLSTAGKGLINSGFLQGPFIAAYGAGALIIYPFTVLFSGNPLWLQCILYAVLATIIEYFAHYLVEKFMDIRIWDYSDEFLNFQGRISLKYSFFWFLLVMFMVTVLQPGVIKIIEMIPGNWLHVTASVFLVFLLADTFYSAYIFNRFSALISQLCEAFDLPLKEMKELQFNRPRIMNEKQRIEKIFEDADYAALNKYIEEKLLTSENEGYFGFDKHGFGTIINNEKYTQWRTSSPERENIYLTHLRIAELSWHFCKKMNLDATGAAAGILMAAYYSDSKSLFQKIIDLFLPQLRILHKVKKDIKNVNKIEKDVIKKYKWPLALSAPLTLESVVVSFAEKLIVSKEFRNIIKNLYEPEFSKK